MSTHRNIDKICVVITVLSLILTVLFMNGEALGIEVVRDQDAESYTGTEWFTANDLNGEWDDSDATVITLNGDKTKISGGGAYAYKGSVVITQGGRYVISGSLTDGSITVDAKDYSKVWIRLNGADITCSDDACFIVDQADKVFLTLGTGTDNRMTSGSRYSDEAKEDNTGGTIFAHDDLTINGSGTLTISGPYKHGIDANDTLVITGGTISISASSDGIHVNDSFRFTGADLTISSNDDAIHCDKEIYVAGGTILIEKCYEGLEAHTIDITDGDITIYPSDDGLNANGGSGFGWGYVPSFEEDEEDDGNTYVRISGGTLTIINRNGRDADGIDSNGDIYIDGGSLFISLPGDTLNNAIDYGSESGFDCIVTGGEFIACGGSMMAEPFSSDSTQCAVLLLLDNTILAETPIRILDNDGNELLSFTPPCEYSSIAFSSPAMTVGKTYTVEIGYTSLDLTLNSTATKIKSYITSDEAVIEPDSEEPAEDNDPSGFPGGDFPGGQGSFPGEDFPGEQGSFPGGDFPGGEQGSFPSGDFPGGDQGSFPGGDFPGGEQGSFPSGDFPGGDQGGLPEGDFPGGDQGGFPGGDLPGEDQSGSPSEDDQNDQTENSQNEPSGGFPGGGGGGFPGGGGGGFPGGGGGGGFPGGGPGGGYGGSNSQQNSPSSSAKTVDSTSWLLLGLSSAVLIAGFLIVIFYKRRGH